MRDVLKRMRPHKDSKKFRVDIKWESHQRYIFIGTFPTRELAENCVEAIKASDGFQSGGLMTRLSPPIE